MKAGPHVRVFLAQDETTVNESEIRRARYFFAYVKKAGADPYGGLWHREISFSGELPNLQQRVQKDLDSLLQIW